MAATETRMLLLGAVMLFEPVNGYQVRRELLSWGVEEWGHVNPGSIYSGLGTLTRQGHLIRHDLDDGGRTVAVYVTTESGRAEFQRLAALSLETVYPLSPLPFHTAVSLLPLISREEFAKHLGVRLKRLDEARAGIRSKMHAVAVPPHLPTLLELWIRTAKLERKWVREVLERIERGEFSFAGEATEWRAPPEDPGWQMVAEGDRYRRLLRRRLIK